MSAKDQKTVVEEEHHDEPARDKYEQAGDEFEDKLDRQKGDGRDKQAPSGQSKPKSVRSS